MDNYYLFVDKTGTDVDNGKVTSALATEKTTHIHTPGRKCETCGLLVSQTAEEKHEEHEQDAVLEERVSVGIETAKSVFFGKNGEFTIEVKKQKKNYDCGQTCLEMLGYSDHDIKDREVNNLDMVKIFGSKAETHKSEVGDYSTPHIILFPVGSDTFQESRHNHWVIRVNDLVVDPARGVIKAADFEKSYGQRETLVFKAPPKTAS